MAVSAGKKLGLICIAATVAFAFAAEGGITLPPSIIPAGQSVLLSFSNPANPEQLEQSLNIFAGDVTSTTPTPKKPLILENTCNGRWRVKNPNDTNAVFQWKTTNKQFGLGIVAANQNANFQTQATPGRLTLSVNATVMGQKTNSTSPCRTPLFRLKWNDDSTMVRILPTELLQPRKTHSLVLTSDVLEQQRLKPTAPLRKVFVAQKNLLKPGGRYTSPDGVIVEALPGSLDAPVEINIERIPDNEPGLLPPDNDVVTIGQNYRINLGRAVKSANDEYLKIYFPVPQEAVLWISRFQVFELLESANTETDVLTFGPHWSGVDPQIDDTNHIAHIEILTLNTTNVFKLARVK